MHFPRPYSLLLLLLIGVSLGCSQSVTPRTIEPLQLVTHTAPLETVTTTPSEAQATDAPQEITIAPSAEPTTQSTIVASHSLTVQIAHGVPSAWQAALETLPPLGSTATDGTLTVSVGGDGVILGHAAYALVVPRYSLLEAATRAEVAARWQAGTPQLAGSTTTLTAFSQLWGPSGAGVLIIDDPTALADRLWASDDVWGIVPFEQLSAELKTLAIDGQSPLHPTTDISTYLLSLPIVAAGDPAAVAQLQAILPADTPTWRPDKLTRVAITGVTALVRATAYFMEQNGVLWPGEEVRAALNSADIAHLSNEVAFVADCPYPNWIGGTSFCSDVRYFELVQDLGIDVMELTGNHVNDFGWQHLNSSIDLYEAAGMKYFGGGRNLADAQTAAIFEHNGNRIAFVGCNPVGPAYAWAGDQSAGSRPCDPQLDVQIAQLAAEGAVVIMTLQYHEHYFYQPTYQQQLDFRHYIDAGATIISGSQGHHVQGFDLYNGGFIHYGLGNLFFDQMDALGTRQAMIDEYIIYDGRLVGIEFTTGLIEDYARPRLMTPDERQLLFETLFNVSTR